MTLAELLISAEIDPADFAEDVRFIAQDNLKSNMVYLYSGEPSKWENHYSNSIHANYVDFPNGDQEILLSKLASDWTTPLSIDVYTAAWNAAHNVNVKEGEDVKSEWPKVMQQISGNRKSLVVVSFESEFVGTCLINEDRPSYVTGLVESDWWSCFSTTTWQPYVEATQSPSAEAMTAQQIVMRLEELKKVINQLEEHSNSLLQEASILNDEYIYLKEQLLEII